MNQTKKPFHYKYSTLFMRNFSTNFLYLRFSWIQIYPMNHAKSHSTTNTPHYLCVIFLLIPLFTLFFDSILTKFTTGITTKSHSTTNTPHYLCVIFVEFCKKAIFYIPLYLLLPRYTSLAKK